MLKHKILQDFTKHIDIDMTLCWPGQDAQGPALAEVSVSSAADGKSCSSAPLADVRRRGAAVGPRCAVLNT